MFDFLKEFLQVSHSRIKTPIYGLIGFVFVLLNWQPIFYLFFEDVSVADRLAFFNDHTTKDTLVFGPLVGGLVLVLIGPWIAVVLAWAMKIPVRLLQFMNEEKNQKKRIHGLQLKADEDEVNARIQGVFERRKIDEAKRLEEAKAIDGGDVAEEIIKTRNDIAEIEYSPADKAKSVLETLTR